MNKKKALLFGMLLSFAVMVALIVVMLIVTDGKELSEFSSKERQFFAFFVIAEVTACISMLVCAFFTGRLNAENMPKAAPVTRSRQEKVLQRRNILIYIFSALAALLFCIAGIWIRTRAGESGLGTAAVLNVILCILPLLSLILSVILNKRESSRLEKTRLEDMQKLLLAQRSEAEAKSREALEKLRKLRLSIMAFTVLLLFIAAGIAFLGGWVGKGTEGLSFDLSILELLYATGLFAAAISRIPRKIPAVFIEEDPTFLPTKEYPYLYRMAEETANTLGLHAPVRIAVTPDDETGISDLDTVMILKLSLRLVSVLSEQELQAVMYHEFSHVAQKQYTSEDAYTNWLMAGRAEEDTIGALFANFLYGYPDLLYEFQRFIYDYSVSLLRESDADQAMLQFCSREAVASVLLKIYYTERYDYELWITDSINEYEQEHPVPGFLKRQIDAFHSCMRERAGVWDVMMPGEILSRTATHPTVRMRLEALGVTEACALPVSGSAPYLNEVHDAAERLDRLIYEKMQENYPEARKEYYLDPLERIRTFEDAGRPLEEYWEVCEALQTYGRRNEALQICEEVIRTLPEEARTYAYYIKGITLLHQYDAEGLDYLYRVIEMNPFSMESCLDEIGSFCCITGNAEELERYRRKAQVLLQGYIDEYSKLMELHKNDQLSREELPEETLKEILDHIKSIDGGAVQRVYLLRKTVSETLSGSIFILDFLHDMKRDQCYDILDQVRRYLDSLGHWQYMVYAYEDVKKVRPEKIPGSLVYENKEWQEYGKKPE